MTPSSSHATRPWSICASSDKNKGIQKIPVPEGFIAGLPEGGFGWIVLSGILLVTIMMSVPGTALGIMFQDILVTMDSSTATASWAGSISMSASNFISPLVTVAIHTFSSRTTAMFGGVVLSLGLILSYFAYTIELLILFYGLLTGIGYGFCRISCLVLASHYFHERYGIAASVIFTGFGLGRFIFSPLVQITSEQYGFRGTFLVMGAISLNICVGAALFQPARWHYALRQIVRENDTKVALTDFQEVVEMIEHDQSHAAALNEESSRYDVENGSAKAYTEHPEDESAVVQLTNYRNLNHVTTSSSKSNGASKEAISPETKELLNVEEINIKAQEKIGGNWKDKLAGSLDFTLLKESVFYVILGSQVLTYLSLMYGILFFPTLCLDKGLSPMDAAIMPTFRAAAEILGRIVIPFLQAFSHLDPVVFYIITCVVAGFAFMAQALVEGYYLILLTALCTGFLTGGTVVQNTTITLISVGQKKLPSTLGLSAFFQGFFILFAGPLIGRVRDVTGSLVYGFLLITAFQFSCAFVWIFRYFSLRNSGRAAKTTQEAPFK